MLIGARIRLTPYITASLRLWESLQNSEKGAKYGRSGKNGTMQSLFLANFERSWSELRVKLERTSREIGANFAQSWSEVGANLVDEKMTEDDETTLITYTSPPFYICLASFLRV